MMQFFTVESIVAHQYAVDARGGDDETDAGEAVARAYGRHIDSIRPALTDSLRRFLDSGSLHDGTVVAYRRTQETATLWVRQDRGYDLADEHIVELVSLSYSLVADVEVEYHHGYEGAAGVGLYCAYSGEWMYDEVDVLNDGVFEHRILLRIGTTGPWACTLRLRFSRFEYGVEPCDPLWSEDL